MKRTLLIFIASLLWTSVSAYEVSREEARSAAAGFFGLDGSTSALRLVFSGDGTGTKSSVPSVSPEYYVFNNDGGGYVIVSGDNVVRPILAYSDSGAFPESSELPENIRWWLDSIAMSINEERASSAIPSADAVLMWADISRGRTKAGTTVKNLKTVCWNQRDPFNAKCPMDDGKRSASGCVPTALCELMCYYGWPAQGTGSIPSYTSCGTTCGGYTLNTVYDWTSLQKLTTTTAAGNASSTVKNNLSQLIADVGMTMQASYSSGGTSASSTDVVTLFCPHFKYNKAARFERRSYYDQNVWEDMLISEIDKNRPIYYSGEEAPSSGHAFLIDGYDTDKYFHFNFGWGAGYNGFFWIGSQYYARQMAIFDFVPDEKGDSKSGSGRIYLQCSSSGGYYNFKPSGTISKGVGFKMTVYGAVSDGNGSCSCSLKLVHLDKNGNYIEDVSGVKTVTNLSPFYSVGSFTLSNCKLNKDISFGDRIALYAKYSGSSEYVPVMVSRQGEGVEYYPITPYPFIDVKESYSVGEKFYFHLMNNDFPYTWGLSNKTLFSEWRFYLDGKLMKEFNDYSAREYQLPEAGTWTVRVKVRNCSGGALSAVMSAIFEVR